MRPSTVVVNKSLTSSANNSVMKSMSNSNNFENLNQAEQEALLAKERDIKFKLWLQNKSIKDKAFDVFSLYLELFLLIRFSFLHFCLCFHAAVSFVFFCSDPLLFSSI
jgi:hypothetical protein